MGRRRRDRDRAQRIHEDQPTFPTPEDKADYEAAARPPSRLDDRPHGRGLTVVGLSPARSRALPTDPAALRARLEDPDIPLTAMVGGLLSSALTPPDVKVALFEVLKEPAGRDAVPDVTDPRAAPASACASTTPAWNTLFLFDPETGACSARARSATRRSPAATSTTGAW